MIEELKKVKTTAKDVTEAKKRFAKERIFFNLKVEEHKQNTGVEEFFELEFSDSYEAANYFYDECQKITEIIQSIKKKHPKYGNARVKSEALKKFPGLYDKCEQFADVEALGILIDNYFLYENCGYLKVKIAETYVGYYESELCKSVETVLNEPEKAINNIKSSAKEVLRKGNKRLIKFHQDIEKRLK